MDPRTISSFFTDDHERLDALFQSFQSRKSTDPARAREDFRRFKAGLEQHMAWEESTLFGEYNRVDRLSAAGTTELLLSEHARIRDQLEAVQAALSTGADAAESEARLIKILDDHNRTEETVFYPELDEVLTDQERADVLRSLAEGAWETGAFETPSRRSHGDH